VIVVKSPAGGLILQARVLAAIRSRPLAAFLKRGRVVSDGLVDSCA
jgi:hypothetical protein